MKRIRSEVDAKPAIVNRATLTAPALHAMRRARLETIRLPVLRAILLSALMMPCSIALAQSGLAGRTGPAHVAPPVRSDLPAGAPRGLFAKETPYLGESITIEWDASIDDGAGKSAVHQYMLFRSKERSRGYMQIATIPATGAKHYEFEDPKAGSGISWFYYGLADSKTFRPNTTQPSGPVKAHAPYPWYTRLINVERLNVLAYILAFAVLVGWFLRRARQGARAMYVRKISGIDAIEEAIGRATEMGRPILYIPGIEEMYDIQTISSMLVLGEVAKTVARYQSEIIVPTMYPFVMAVAEEVVKAGFYDAGRPDAHRPENILYLSSEQFAFVAGVTGIVMRERPAANLFLGHFYAESLVLAETGFLTGAIQIAGTAEISQLPFFIAACDYTLIGEELFAASVYLSREPNNLSTLKASDWFKVAMLALILGMAVLGAIANVTQSHGLMGYYTSLHSWFMPR